MTRTDYSNLISALKKANSVAVFMHVNPDGDCIGSALALTRFLKNDNKTVTCFAPNLDKRCLPDKFSFLCGFDEICDEYDKNSFDLSVAVDVADVGRLGDVCTRIYLKGKYNAVVDHHKESTDFAQTIIREENAASTTQILYKILSQYDEGLIDEQVAKCLYTGLITDSGGFTFNNTTPETLIIASKLLEKGIDNAEINRIVMRDVTKNVFNLKNRVLSRAEFLEDKKIGLIIFRAEDFDATCTTEKDTEGIINNILNIVGVELAVSISEVGDKSYKVSFRSKHTVDASACAKCFGGGGHFHAAGCRVYGYFEDVKTKILDVVKEMLSYA